MLCQVVVVNTIFDVTLCWGSSIRECEKCVGGDGDGELIRKASTVRGITVELLQVAME